MAATIPSGSTLILGSPSDGETYTGKAVRFGMGAGSVVGGAGKLARRGGIIPAQGNPLEATVTSATSITLKAGSIFVPAANGQGGFTLTLTTDTVIDTITSDPTNPRLDILVAEVVSDDATNAGTTWQIKRVTGTAGASPARPSLVTGLPTNGQWEPICQIRVNAAGAGLVISKAAGIDGVATVAPGGIVPVSANAEAQGELPPQAFFVTPDNVLGVMVGATAYQYGLMCRVNTDFSSGSGVNITDGNGEGAFGWAVPVNGTLVTQPFPNGCFTVHLQEAAGGFGEPLMLKLLSKSASGCTFRLYRLTGSGVGGWTAFAGASVVIHATAMGW